MAPKWVEISQMLWRDQRRKWKSAFQRCALLSNRRILYLRGKAGIVENCVVVSVYPFLKGSPVGCRDLRLWSSQILLQRVSIFLFTFKNRYSNSCFSLLYFGWARISVMHACDYQSLLRTDCICLAPLQAPDRSQHPLSWSRTSKAILKALRRPQVLSRWCP